jgi:nitrilase
MARSAPFRAAAIQMVSTPRVEENLAEAGKLVARAAAEGARLVALPEYFCIFGMRDGDKVAAREQDGSGRAPSGLAGRRLGAACLRRPEQGQEQLPRL